MISYLTSLDTIALSPKVLEIMPVNILKAKQNGGIWPFKGRGHESIFSVIKWHLLLSNGAFVIFRMKIGWVA